MIICKFKNFMIYEKKKITNSIKNQLNIKNYLNENFQNRLNENQMIS